VAFFNSGQIDARKGVGPAGGTGRLFFRVFERVETRNANEIFALCALLQLLVAQFQTQNALEVLVLEFFRWLIILFTDEGSQFSLLVIVVAFKPFFESFLVNTDHRFLLQHNI